MDFGNAGKECNSVVEYGRHQRLGNSFKIVCWVEVPDLKQPLLAMKESWFWKVRHLSRVN